jgi:tRNA(fMet)-specific endonuclease VapC
MAGKLLDANAVIAFQNNDPMLVKLLTTSQSTWYIPAPALGELYYGAYNSGQVGKNLDVVDQLSISVVIIRCDRFTARLYGEIRHSLKVKGRPIPETDIWIAALAVQHSLSLVTRDAHFKEVGQLIVETW